MRAQLLLVLFALAVLAPGRELVLNGSFENGINSWTVDTSNGSSVGRCSLKTSTSYRPGPDYSVQVYKYCRLYARLHQTVSIPDVNVRFSGLARLNAWTGGDSGAYAALIVEYRSSGNSLLGRTVFHQRVGRLPAWNNSSTERYVSVTSSNWEEYGFLIADELRDCLTGINPANVARIRIVLDAYGHGINPQA